MQGEAGAIMRVPPTGSDSGNAQAAKTAIAGATNVSLGLSADQEGAWFTFKNVSDTLLAYIRFGPPGIGAALTSDYFLSPGVAEEWWIGVDQGNFSVLTAGVVYYKSSRD